MSIHRAESRLAEIVFFYLVKTEKKVKNWIEILKKREYARKMNIFS